MVLNASEYGNVPQNRERIYIIGFKIENGLNNFRSIEPISLDKKISDIIDFNQKVDNKYYYKKDICSFFDELEAKVKNKDTLYQWRRFYVRENKSNLCPTLTANMGTGGHNVPIVLPKYGIRKLTPKECFLFQGYPSDFELPSNLAQSHFYKQADNWVVVPVIKRLATEIMNAVKRTDKKL